MTFVMIFSKNRDILILTMDLLSSTSQSYSCLWWFLTQRNHDLR
uniref:Uncharacterized protein n=1 Tax=Arundo donax TaxID=35708 RepID=A0A0A9BK54_ARUDO